MESETIIFKPSAWPFFGSVFLFPLGFITVFFLYLELIVALFSTLVFGILLYIVLLKGFWTKMRALNAIGALNAVVLSPKGVEHRSWEWLKFPKHYSYSWSDIEELRMHRPSFGYEMIAFTPIKPEVGKFFRSSFDGTYGVPRYGHSDKMFRTMVSYHARYSNSEL